MRKSSKIAIAVATALSLGLGAAELSAHPGGMGWGGYGPGYGMHGFGMGYGMGPGAGYGMQAYGMGYGANPAASEDRLAGLKAELGINAKQEPAWQSFVKSMKQRDESRQAWFAKMREARAAGTLPELMAQQDEVFKQHQAERQAATAAMKEFYAALTPEQKAIADQRLGGFGPGYGPGYGRGPGGRFR
jgi:hypothetical protein